MLLFNLYDDWLKTISSYTAFSRLILILRCVGCFAEACVRSWAICLSTYLFLHPFVFCLSACRCGMLYFGCGCCMLCMLCALCCFAVLGAMAVALCT